METNADETYRALAKHLDSFPGGFPPSDTGADIRLLQRLFTPEEARLAVLLTIERQSVAEIASKAGYQTTEAESLLNTMAEKGLILPIYSESEETQYQAVPFVVGIYEFQINNLSEDFLKDFNEYRQTSTRRREKIRQMRVIPSATRVEVNPIALPYERANDLVDAHSIFAVAPCICRQKAKMQGEGCDAPMDSCIFFGEWAEFYIRTGRGRKVDADEVKVLLAKADESNLVLQPANSKRIMFVCCCCGCCCGALKSLKALPNPGEAVESPFIAKLTPENCTSCGLCLDRCQMNALSEGQETVELDASRCIGCGLCVSTCPGNALELVRRPGTENPSIPDELNTTWQSIIHAR
jgi:Pyruvate/2-oxoacid:ferredoxin oxidoreductase delta subunit